MLGPSRGRGEPEFVFRKACEGSTGPGTKGRRPLSWMAWAPAGPPSHGGGTQRTALAALGRLPIEVGHVLAV